MIYSANITKVCETQDCFVARAERCDPATFTMQEDDQIVTSTVTPDCSTITQIEYVNEDGTRELFSKKTCFYEKYKFVDTLVESDVVYCETEEI